MENIVEGLNQFIELERIRLNIPISGHIILHKTIETCEFSKAYKQYKARLYYIDQINKIKYEICGATIQNRVINNQDAEILKELEIQLSKAIFQWTQSELYNKVIYGK